MEGHARRASPRHKLRFLLTALAVVLGVSFISGTLVLTATIQKTFDDLFANINRGTDAAVRAHEVAQGRLRRRPARRTSRRRSSTVVTQDADRRGRGRATSRRTRRSSTSDGKVIGGNGPPTFGVGWDPNPKLNQFHLVSGRAPRDRRRDRHRQADGRQGRPPRRRPGHGPHDAGAARSTTSSGIAKFGTVDSLAGASIIVVHAARGAARRATSRTSSRRSRSSPSPASRRTQVAQRHPSDAGRERRPVSTR